jgi:hypothetical protein
MMNEERAVFSGSGRGGMRGGMRGGTHHQRRGDSSSHVLYANSKVNRANFSKKE